MEGSDIVHVSSCGTKLRRKQRSDGHGELAPVAEQAALPTTTSGDREKRKAEAKLIDPVIDVRADAATPASEKTTVSTQETSHVEDNQVLVSGLPWSCGEDILRKDFSECGEILELKLLTDRETGRSRGLAFITFKNEEGVQAALKYDGDDYGGRTMYVKKADKKGKGKAKGDGQTKGKDGKGKGKGKGSSRGPGPKPANCKSIVMKSLAFEVTEEDLRLTFQTCGNGPSRINLLRKDTGASKGIAFVDFEDESAVDEAMKLNETELKGRTFHLDYVSPRET